MSTTARRVAASIDQVTWKDFGVFLQHLRARRGISQERAAELFHCSRNHIWRMEHGQTRPSRILLGGIEGWLRYLQGPDAATDEEKRLLACFDALRTYDGASGEHGGSRAGERRAYHP